MFTFVFALFAYIYIIRLYISLRKILLKENHVKIKDTNVKTPIFSKISFRKQIYDFNLKIKPSVKADQLELS